MKLTPQPHEVEGGRGELWQLLPETTQHAGRLNMVLLAFFEAGGCCMQELRKEAGQWVAKYARGGSARKLSARRFYIAVDALQGHLASNGQAPFPRQKIPVLQSNVQQARDLIAQGK